MFENICPKCNKKLNRYDIIDWDNDLEIYECDCGCIVDYHGKDISEDYYE